MNYSLSLLLIALAIFTFFITFVERRRMQREAALERRMDELVQAQRALGVRLLQNVEPRVEHAVEDAHQSQRRLENRVEGVLEDLTEFVNLLAEKSNSPVRLGVDGEGKQVVVRLKVVPGDDRPTAFERIQKDDPDAP